MSIFACRVIRSVIIASWLGGEGASSGESVVPIA